MIPGWSAGKTVVEVPVGPDTTAGQGRCQKGPKHLQHARDGRKRGARENTVAVIILPQNLIVLNAEMCRCHRRRRQKNDSISRSALLVKNRMVHARVVLPALASKFKPVVGCQPPSVQSSVRNILLLGIVAPKAFDQGSHVYA